MVLLIDSLPSHICHGLASRTEGIVAARDDNLGGQVLVDREELREVGFCDQEIHALFDFREAVIGRRDGRRNQRMMGTDFLIVPATTLDARIGLWKKCLEVGIRNLGQILEDSRCIRQLIGRQVLAVRARIRGEFLLIETLHGIKDLLR